MLYYTIKDNKLCNYSNYKYDENCLETELTTQQEMDETPGKYIIENNELVLNPNYEQEQEAKEKERIAKLSLTKREVFLALYDAKGITPDTLKAQITDPRALIEFEYANDYYRFNPLIDTIGALLGYSADDLDYLFINKKFPENAAE